MVKILAIKGHKSRGEEVIKILEMLGGKNLHNYCADCDGLCFYISKTNIIHYDWLYETEDKIIFTLEEFLAEYPFKVGDKVFLYDNITEGCVNGMEWDEEKLTVKYCVYTSAEYWCDVKELLKWNNIDLVEKHYIDNMDKKDKNLEKVQSSKDNSIFIMEHSMWPNIKDCFLEYEIPNGYEFDKIENGNIILKPIKPKYPTTYEDCCKVLGISYRTQLSYTNPDVERGNTYLTKEKQLLDSFMRLRICRNAYWHMAGVEMGLGKPWEPDWSNNYQKKWIINFYQGEINLTTGPNVHFVLTFPSDEICDYFYENFKDLIEKCKKLL